MSASADYTWDISPARRPSLDDLGGDAKENDLAFPPDPVLMPTAEEHNQFANQLHGLARVGFSCLVHVIYTAGAPSVAEVAAMGNNVTTGSFTLTDNGNGDTTIQWASGLLPPGGMPPLVWLAADDAALHPTGEWVTGTEIRVRTRDNANVLTDFDFVIAIF